ncbi:hypothetical protein [Vibrio fluvialis]|uniref:hypothetical protein n=1 Tax=Vibrio fluvialis TaxID=676 RepID=UPI001F2190D3|nr:hypothetical protein [Vibrio fluvialis]MCE7607960.1 hypothetical protein [Vibrio fluvialis]
MTSILREYGVLISVSFSALFIFVGWLVILHNTKFITSRNEAKSIVNDITKLIEQAVKDASLYWNSYEKASKDEITLFTSKSLATVVQVRDYQKLLESYDITVLNSSKISQFKKLLTLTPDAELTKPEHYKELNKYLNQRVIECQKYGGKLIFDIHTAFLTKHKPTTKSFTDLLFESNLSWLISYKVELFAVVFTLLFLVAYFYIGSIFLPLKV